MMREKRVVRRGWKGEGGRGEEWRVVLFLRIAYCQPFNLLAFNPCFLSP